jgi:phosphoglycerol transferase MdoB-like AlkP superfamily enzyme
MDLVTASAISIGLLGGIGAFLLLLAPATLGLTVWTALIGFATFYWFGGKEAGLAKAITHNIFGAILGLILLLLVELVPLSGAIGAPLWIGIGVLITLFILVVASKWATLGSIPASLLGYAPLLAYVGKSATAVSLDNPFVGVVISLVIGAVLGYLAEKLTAVLAKK